MAKYATFQRREMLQQEINNAERVLGRTVRMDPEGQSDAPEVGRDHLQNAGGIEGRVQRMKSELARVTPPDVADEQRPEVQHRVQQLEQAMKAGLPSKGVPPMRSRQQMWDKRATDAGQHLMWEKWIKNHNITPDGRVVRTDSRKGERSMLDERKDLVRVLAKEQEEYAQDVASVEAFRPDRTESTNLIEYGSKSFSPFAGLTTEEYLAIWPEHQLTPVEVKVAAAEAAGVAKAPRPEDIYARGACSETKKDGSPCSGKPIKGQSYCVFHKPKE